MASVTQRLFSSLLAAALIVGLGTVPAYAQLTPGAPTVGPAGGTPSTSAPSNSEGTPAGGTGVIGNTRVAPATAARPVARTTAAQRRAQAERRRVARAAQRQTPPAASTGAASSSGLNNSNATSR